MQLRAFLASRALERGLNSGIPAVRRKADEMRQAVQSRLDALNGGPAGITAAQTFINGMATGIRQGVGVIDDALYYLKVNSIGGSLPKSGPMTGARIAEGARAIAGKFRDELGTGLRQGVSLSGLSLSGAVGGAAGMAGGGGGTTIVVQSMYPPTPAQLAEYARLQFPYLERERTRQQRRPN